MSGVNIGDEVQFLKDQDKGASYRYQVIAIDGTVAWIRSYDDGKNHFAWLHSLTSATRNDGS